jgi:hypothetical protein
MGVSFLIAAVLIVTLTCSEVLGSYDGPVRNFRVDSIEGGRITFAWEIQSGYTSSISYYHIFYALAYTGYTPYSYHSTFGSFSPSSSYSYSYKYSTSVTSFGSYGQYIMWLRVRRSSTPSYIYSEQIYVEVGIQIPIELNIKLWHMQTCFNFMDQSTSLATVVEYEVYRALRLYCECTYGLISNFRVDYGYFSCSPKGDYITFRALIISSYVYSDPSTLVGALKAWLNDKQNSSMIVNERKHYVEVGPCGIQIPSMKAPHCDKE